MVDVSVSRISRLRVWVASRSVSWLLLIWLSVYVGAGLIFALLYKAMPQCAVKVQSGGCESGFWNLVYFSLSNQSTLTYGDYLPTGLGRYISAAQGFVGLTMNALALGVVVFKALKRSNPLVFSKYLVYELEKHKFWLRFINVDGDQLRDVQIRVQFVQFPSDETDYDTQANHVEIDVELFPAIPRLRLFADRFKSNNGKTVGPNGDLKDLILAPGHFSGAATKYVEITIRGYFESTGDLFFHTKRYALGDIRCGTFDGVDNNALQAKPDRVKAKELSQKLDRVISTSAEKCLACPHHETCSFDVAVETRAKPA
jgi:hypothetical protein